MSLAIATEKPVGGAGANPAPFTLINNISTTTATSGDVMLDNVIKNIKRDLPRLHHLEEFQKIKGFEKKIAIVGGGPSLKKELVKLREFDVIIAAGSTNDFLMEYGIEPTYTVVCDPDKISSYYLKRQSEKTKYLIATCCDDEIFKVLEGKHVYMWHCHSDAQHKYLAEIEKDYQGIGGGCTVGLRSISIAIMLGYTNLHMFGFDSSLGEDDNCYSYPFAPEEGSTQLGTIHEIRLGSSPNTPSSKTYRCLGYQLAQASHFKDFYQGHAEYFTPTFHGEGLLPDMVRMIQVKAKQLSQEATKNE